MGIRHTTHLDQTTVNQIRHLMRHYLLLLLLVLCSGCIPTKQIIPSDDGGRFVIEEDIFEFYEGLFGDRFLAGLTKGEYIAIGHDEDGVYYRGPHKCLVFLNEEQGYHFLATGERPGTLSNPREINLFTGDEGGVFVPYNFEDDDPWYFHYADYRNVTGDADSKIPPRPTSSINKPGPETIPAAAVYMLPNVKIINGGAPNALPPAEAAVGGAIGVVAGRQLGLAGLRDAQGGILPGVMVKSEKVLAIIRNLKTR